MKREKEREVEKRSVTEEKFRQGRQTADKDEAIPRADSPNTA